MTNFSVQRRVVPAVRYLSLSERVLYREQKKLSVTTLCPPLSILFSRYSTYRGGAQRRSN